MSQQTLTPNQEFDATLGTPESAKVLKELIKDAKEDNVVASSTFYSETDPFANLEEVETTPSRTEK